MNLIELQLFTSATGKTTITTQTAFHHCIFQVITAHFAHVKTSPGQLTDNPVADRIRPPFPGAAIPSVRRYIHNAYAIPYERSSY